MYTGSSLFKGLTVGQVFFMVVYEAHRPAIPEDCPEAFVSLMTSCWSAAPADRYVSIVNKPSFEQGAAAQHTANSAMLFTEKSR